VYGGSRLFFLLLLTSKIKYRLCINSDQWVWKVTDPHQLRQARRPFQLLFLHLHSRSLAWHLVVFTNGLVRWCAAVCDKSELTDGPVGDKLDLV
jgi:hypothetical protein